MMHVPQRAALSADFVQKTRKQRGVDEKSVGFHERSHAAALGVGDHFGKLLSAQIDVAAVEVRLVSGHHSHKLRAHLCRQVDVGFRLVHALSFDGMIGKRRARSQGGYLYPGAVEQFFRAGEVVGQFLYGGGVYLALDSPYLYCGIAEIRRGGHYIRKTPVRAAYR